jgi:hypothetical protein
MVLWIILILWSQGQNRSRIHVAVGFVVLARRGFPLCNRRGGWNARVTRLHHVV